MIEQKQLFLHKPNDPENRTIGDCWRTCIACILDIHPDKIPHFYEELWTDGKEPIVLKVHEKTNEWLLNNGYPYFVEHPVIVDDNSVEMLQQHLAWTYPDTYVIIGCSSKNGGHSVVMNGAYIWDPAIDNSGCVGPMSDGYYWIGLLLDPKTFKKRTV